jgi:hypothetical protein
MFGGGARRDNNGPPVWLIIFAVSILVYAISFILIRTISRYREYAADRGSALITGAPEYLMSELQKISSQMTMIPNQDLRQVRHKRLLHHPRRVKGFSSELFMDHPPIEKRLAALAESRAIWAARSRRWSSLPGWGFATLSGRKAPGYEGIPASRAAGELQVGWNDLCRRGRDHVQAQSSGEFQCVRRVDKLLDAVAQRSGSTIRRSLDFGYDWIVVDPQLEDMVGTAHTLAAELTAQGFGEQLLAAIFKFDGGEHPVYWIYGFKRGSFWPFVPSGKDTRDNATELELKAKLEHELPIEPDLTRWLALFDAPL